MLRDLEEADMVKKIIQCKGQNIQTFTLYQQILINHDAMYLLCTVLSVLCVFVLCQKQISILCKV